MPKSRAQKSPQRPAKRRAIKHTRATISDVALYCDLSKTTVSRILSNGLGRFNIKASTIEKVQAAAKKLGYQPNRLARAIASNRTHLIGIAIPARRVFQPDSATPISVVTSISHILLSGILSLPEFKDYDLVIHKFDEVPGESEMLENFKEELLDGLIMVDPGAQATGFLTRAAHKMPVIALGSYDQSIRFRALDADNRRLAFLATRYLTQNFGSNVLLVENSFQAGLYCMTLRREGFLQGLPGAAGTKKNRIVALPIEGDVLPPAIFQQVWETHRPRAILTTNDEVAVAVLHAAQALNLQVPGDLAIMGFGDAVVAQTARPSLSTVRFPFFQLARRAASEIIACLDQGNTYRPGFSLLEEGEIIVRESTTV